jgi:putative transposase
LGLIAGPVPPRVQAPVKAGLLALVEHAVHAGWSTRRSCSLLGLDPDRAAAWRDRSCAGQLADRPCGGGAVHGLLDSERAAILELFEAWAGIDRSHRKLAARGSRIELVHVSASTVLRVLAAEGLVLQGPAAREPQVRAPWPEWICWKPNSVWCYDLSHFTRARRVAVAVMDVISRRWLSTLVSAPRSRAPS